MQKTSLKMTVVAVALALTTGCASNGMYSGGSNLAIKTVGGALIGTAIGGLTASESDVRGGMRRGAAYGAAAGGLFAAGENYGAAQSYNAQHRARSQQRYQQQRYQSSQGPVRERVIYVYESR